MKVDFPTLGTPTTMARTGRPTSPLAFHCSSFSFSACRMTVENWPTPLPSLALVSSTAQPCLRNQSVHTRFMAGSA